MRVGVVFPQNQIGTDAAAIRAFAREVERLGFAHLLAFDHVIGSRGTYAGQPFHELMVLMGHLAAVTERIELTLGVMVLPQRQTALAAKQIATLDLLSGERLRAGVGAGWAEEEFAALGQPFHRRGRRMDRQLAALRALWTRETVQAEVDGERFRDVGLNPPPARRPPLWVGGRSRAAARRVAEWGEGWLLNLQNGYEADRERFLGHMEDLDGALAAVGRPRSEVGLEVWLPANALPEERWAADAAAWEALGVTHLTVRTEGALPRPPAEHLALLGRVAAVLL
jgi:probable F420-dependent oxidoreductase